MITSNGQPYMNWQTRVFYQTWLKAKDQPGSPLAHFTRVLHRTRDDELTLEVPTVRIDPTHPECDDGCDYAVKDRARRHRGVDHHRGCAALFARAHGRGGLPPGSFPAPERDARARTRVRIFVRIHHPMARRRRAGESRAPRPRPVGRADGGRASIRKRAPGDPRGRPGRSGADVGGSRRVGGVVEDGARRLRVGSRDMYAFDFAAARVGLRVHYPPVPHNKLMVQPPRTIPSARRV